MRAPSLTAVLICAAIVGAVALARCNGGSGSVAQPAAPVPRPAVPTVSAVPSGTPAFSAGQPAGPASDAESNVKEAPVAAAPVVVAVLGDSLSDGRVGGGGFWKLLQKRCPESRFVDHGKGGDMVNMMRARFFKHVMNEDGVAFDGTRYTHVVVFGGVNDMYSDLTAGRTVAKVAKDLTRVYAASRKHGAKVVAITVTPWGGFSKYFNPRRGEATLRLNEWISNQREVGAVDFVIDAYPMLSCGRPTHLCKDFAHPIRDGLHLGPAGHEKLGEALHERVFSSCR